MTTDRMIWLFSATTLLLSSIVCQDTTLGKEIPSSQVVISLVKIRDDGGQTRLYFKIDNHSDQNIDIAEFDCHVFDRGSKFLQYMSVIVRRVKSGASGYVDQSSRLGQANFGRIECRLIDVLPE